MLSLFFWFCFLLVFSEINLMWFLPHLPSTGCGSYDSFIFKASVALFCLLHIYTTQESTLCFAIVQFLKHSLYSIPCNFNSCATKWWACEFVHIFRGSFSLLHSSTAPTIPPQSPGFLKSLSFRFLCYFTLSMTWFTVRAKQWEGEEEEN